MTRHGPRGAPRLAYDPALDGVRAVAVVAVLCFHGGFTWARGGFLGVSVFFTLSGYLITSLLLAEHDATGTIGVTAFWGRRLRRLLPASLACLAGVAVLAATGVLDRAPTLRGDLLASVLDVANWRFYFGGRSYGQLFASPSPLQHFWSLAIEEQIYLALPLVVWAALVRARGGRITLAAVLAVAWIASTASSVVLGARNPDLVYYATFTRAAELLTGALAAVAVAALAQRRQRNARAASDAGAVRRGALVDHATALAGAGALGLVIGACTSVRQGDAWLARGGLAAFSVASLTVVLAARLPGPVRSFLGVAPLAWLGRISYGVYLYHWPLYLVLDPARTGLDRGPLFAVRVAATLTVATASYYLLERPIREGRALRGRPARLAAPASVAGLAAASFAFAPAAVPTWSVVAERAPMALVATRSPTAPVDAPSAAAAAPSPSPAGTSPAVLDGSVAAPSSAPPAGGPEPVAPARILLAGDSTANALAPGLVSWAADSGRATVDASGVKIGCGYVPTGRDKVGPQPRDLAGPCGDVLDKLRDAAAASEADVALVVDGPWEVTDHQAPNDRWRSPGDAVFDERLTGALGAATDLLLEHVRVVVWATSPVIHPGWGFAVWDDAWEPERMTVLNRIIRSVAAERPGRVVVVDYAAWMDGSPVGKDAEVRPDGVHLAPPAARTVADWLGPQLLAAAANAPPAPG